MTVALVAIGALVVGSVALFTFALCRVAARGDVDDESLRSVAATLGCHDDGLVERHSVPLHLTQTLSRRSHLPRSSS
jgi:hypothetical protein